MSVVLLLAVLAGFAPTFYLRPTSQVGMLPPHLIFHGTVLTLWFAWFVLQTWLVFAGRTAQHRTLGVLGAIIGAACVVGGPLATSTAIQSLLDLGLRWDTNMSEYPTLSIEILTLSEYGPSLVFGNLGSTALFAGLLAFAVRYRHRSDVHKRLMLLASINFMPPALARLSRLPGMGGEDGLLIPGVFAALLGALIAHDLMTLKRIHPASKAGIGATIIVTLAAVGLSQTDWALALVQRMGNIPTS